MKDKVIVEFNEDNLERFLKEYYKTHRKSKEPIVASPLPRSMNKILTVTNRIVQNNHKQNRGLYTKFVIKDLGLEMIGIDKTDLKVEFIFPTKVRHDLDNLIGGLKEIMDSFTDLGVITDDDYLHIKSITSSARYEKGVCKTILTFENCKYDIPAMERAMAKEREKREKRDETMRKNKLKKKNKKVGVKK